MKYILPFLMVLAGAGYYFYEPPLLGVASEEELILNEIAAEQVKEKTANGKYAQMKKDGTSPQGRTFTKTKGDINNVEIHEYVTSKGEAGYQVFLEYLDGTKKSVGYGVEAQHRTYTILPPQVDLTATTTPK